MSESVRRVRFTSLSYIDYVADGSFGTEASPTMWAIR